MMESYMQSSMGYTCHTCGKTYLIGWKHIDTNKNFCDSCKENSKQLKEKFVEKIY